MIRSMILVRCLLLSPVLSLRAQAADPQIVLHTLECNEFRVDAKTVFYDASGPHPHGTEQTMILTDPSLKLSKRLNLNQHRSHDRDLPGKLALDALAYEWRCVSSTRGQKFLEVDFACTNEQASTCFTAMDVPGNEWYQVYSAAGQPFFRNPQRVFVRDDSRLEALGLKEALEQSDAEHTKNVFYDDK